MSIKVFQTKVAVTSEVAIRHFCKGQNYWNKHHPKQQRRLLFCTIEHEEMSGEKKEVHKIIRPYGATQFYVPLCLLTDEEKMILNSINVERTQQMTVIIFSDPSQSKTIAEKLGSFNTYSNILLDGHMMITDFPLDVIQCFAGAKMVDKMPRDIMNMMKVSPAPTPDPDSDL